MLNARKSPNSTFQIPNYKKTKTANPKSDKMSKLDKMLETINVIQVDGLYNIEYEDFIEQELQTKTNYRIQGTFKKTDESRGVNFKELGIDTLYNKQYFNNTIHSSERDLSIFIVVHGGDIINNKSSQNIIPNSNVIQNNKVKQNNNVILNNCSIDFYADRINLYTSLKTVKILDNYWKLHYNMYYRKNIFSLMLIYLSVNFLFKSSKNKLSPYSKMYSGNKLNQKCKTRSNTKTQTNTQTSNTSNSKRNPVKIPNVHIDFGNSKDIEESYMCIMYTQKGVKDYKYDFIKINFKLLEKVNYKELFNIKENEKLSLEKLLKYVKKLEKNIIKYHDDDIDNKKKPYVNYDIVYCQTKEEIEKKIQKNQYAELTREIKDLELSELYQTINKYRKNLQTKTLNFYHNPKIVILTERNINRDKLYDLLSHPFEENRSKILDKNINEILENNILTFITNNNTNQPINNNVVIGTNYQKALEAINNKAIVESNEQKALEALNILFEIMGGNKKVNQLRGGSKSRIKPTDCRMGKYKCNGHTHRTKITFDKCKQCKK